MFNNHEEKSILKNYYFAFKASAILWVNKKNRPKIANIWIKNKTNYKNDDMKTVIKKVTLKAMTGVITNWLPHEKPINRFLLLVHSIINQLIASINKQSYDSYKYLNRFYIHSDIHIDLNPKLKVSDWLRFIKSNKIYFVFLLKLLNAMERASNQNPLHSTTLIEIQFSS